MIPAQRVVITVGIRPIYRLATVTFSLLFRSQTVEYDLCTYAGSTVASFVVAYVKRTVTVDRSAVVFQYFYVVFIHFDP